MRVSTRNYYLKDEDFFCLPICVYIFFRDFYYAARQGDVLYRYHIGISI